MKADPFYGNTQTVGLKSVVMCQTTICTVTVK